MRPVRVLAHLAPLLALIATGCSKSPVRPIVPSATTSGAWAGHYTGAGPNGDMVLELSRTGDAVSGRIVWGPSSAEFGYVAGSASGDSIFLGYDRAHTAATDLMLRARVIADSSLSGHFAVGSLGIDGPFTARVLLHRSIVADETHLEPFAVIALGYDGAHLWLSTIDFDYLRTQLDLTIVDSIAIPHEPAATWVSSVLAYDGVRFWGLYPITLGTPGGDVNVSDLLGFDASGRTSDSIRVNHRPAGLAWDGAHFWSLRGVPMALVRFGRSGIVDDSLHVEVPDADQLAFDGAHFWTVGWRFEQLFELDLAGHIVAMCQLPKPSPADLPVGLVCENGHLWYASGIVGTTTIHRLTLN